MAPERDFVVPYYHQLLDRTPKGRVDEFRAFRHDEYANGAAVLDAPERPAPLVASPPDGDEDTH